MRADSEQPHRAQLAGQLVVGSPLAAQHGKHVAAWRASGDGRGETSAAMGELFRGFSGYVQADAKSVYDLLFKPAAERRRSTTANPTSTSGTRLHKRSLLVAETVELPFPTCQASVR